jgi:metallo-beta-lactamase family protein
MSIDLSFHGGVDTVTGSCHLLRAGGLHILVDCGMFQGGRQTEEMNYGDFGFDPASIDFLLLTHAHLDHCGRIPLLVRKGFKGKIITTSATFDIAKVVIMDSAQIQEEDFEHWQRIKRRKGMKQREPLYTTLDALDSLRYFSTFAEYGKHLTLNSRVKVTFRDAGHILGAAFLELDVKGKGRLIFSGDLGNREKPIIRDPSLPSQADIFIIEGTYADRNHKDIDHSVRELRDAVVETFQRGGNVLIPSFAIERAQEILFFLGEFHRSGEIPPCKVFLDSPMAISVTNIMRRHPECFDEETYRVLKKQRDPFSFPGLEFTRSREESLKINFLKSQAIIIAGSGMCTAGRIKHHLKHHLWRKESSIVFVGYQARGTLGRKIVDRAKTVKIFRESYRVRATTYTIGGFSAHADREILLEWLHHSRNTEHIFLVHGEKKSLTSFRKEIKKRGLARKTHIPHLHQRISV